MAHGHHEVPTGEDHQLAGLDDLVGRGRRRVGHVADRLEHREQHVVAAARRPGVALDLRALVGVHGVLDGEGVQPEGLGDVGDLLGVGLVEPDPDEALLAAADLLDRLAMAPAALEAAAVDVDRAVDDERREGDRRDGGGRAPADDAGTGGAQGGQGRHGRRSSGETGAGAGSASPAPPGSGPQREGETTRPVLGAGSASGLAVGSSTSHLHRCARQAGLPSAILLLAGPVPVPRALRTGRTARTDSGVQEAHTCSSVVISRSSRSAPSTSTGPPRP